MTDKSSICNLSKNMTCNLFLNKPPISFNLHQNLDAKLQSKFAHYLLLENCHFGNGKKLLSKGKMNQLPN